MTSTGKSPPDADRGPRRGPDQSALDKRLNPDRTSGPSPVFEWRVTWRRTAWSANSQSKSRILQRSSDARRLLEKILDHQERGLSPAIVRLDRRPVGLWETVEEHAP